MKGENEQFIIRKDTKPGIELIHSREETPVCAGSIIFGNSGESFCRCGLPVKVREKQENSIITLETETSLHLGPNGESFFGRLNKTTTFRVVGAIEGWIKVEMLEGKGPPKIFWVPRPVPQE